MKNNIPIYRAKKIDSDEYVIGYYSPAYDIHHYIITHLGVDTKVDVVYQMSTDIHKIDPTTLAINFEDMIDSQGNKIFASLQEDGKGGSIANYDNKGNWIAMYIENAFMWVNVKDMEKVGTKEPVSFLRLKPLAKMVSIGIQE